MHRIRTTIGCHKNRLLSTLLKKNCSSIEKIATRLLPCTPFPRTYIPSVLHSNSAQHRIRGFTKTCYAQTHASSGTPLRNSPPPKNVSDSNNNYSLESINTSIEHEMQQDDAARRMILTDAMALLYRSHFAFGADHRLRNSMGEDTTVLFGFLSTLLSLLELSPPPTHLVVVFDASGKTFRHELFPGYKGHRPETPEEIKLAVPKLQKLLEMMEIPVLSVPGVEADDVIGTLAVRGVEREGMAVAIASPDKDFFQLLRPGLILLRPSKKSDAMAAVAAGAPKAYKYALQPYTVDKFKEEWNGLEPWQFVDALALMGDASDNVPGVSGIGPKTATSLLLAHGSLDVLLAQAENIVPKKKATAVLATSAGAAAAKLSKQLVEIRTELDLPPVTCSMDTFRLRAPKDGGKKALELLKALDFEIHSRRLQHIWKRYG